MKGVGAMLNDNNQSLISSPEDLGKYLTIANPFVWISIILIAVILSGFMFWGITGSIDTCISAGTVSSGENVLCYVGENEIGKIEEGMTVKIEDFTGKVLSIPETAVKVSESKELYALHLSGIDETDWAYPVELDIKIPNGIYKAKIVIKSEKPISFVIN